MKNEVVPIEVGFDNIRHPEVFTQIAASIQEHVKKNKLVTYFKGKNGEMNAYPQVEAWQFCGALLGLFPKLVDTQDLSDDRQIKFRATVEIVEQNTGKVVGKGVAICSNLETGKGYFQEYAVLSMAQCVPLRAEILTKEGFKSFDQITIGEDVLSFDCETNKSYWTALEDVNVFPSTDVYKLENRSFLAYCTEHHTWAVKRQNCKEKLFKTSELPNHGGILLSAIAEGGNLPISPNDAYVMGWILTDGCIRWDGNSPRIHIDQSKVNNLDKIRNALAPYEAKETIRAPYVRTFPTGKTYNCLQSHRFCINSAHSRRILETFGIKSKSDTAIFSVIANLTLEARQAMLDSMLEADGSKKRQKSWRFGKKNQTVMSVFQILATLEGFSLGRMTDDNGMPGQMMRSHKVAHIPSLSIEKHSVEPVWCPTTKYGTWIMRIDGNVMITGNTRATGKAFRLCLGWIMKSAGFEPTQAEEMQDFKEDGDGGGVTDQMLLAEYRRFAFDAIRFCTLAKDVEKLVKGATYLKTDAAFLDMARQKYSELINQINDGNAV